MTPSGSEARTCPCKLLPRSLSSFTAAEYGDIHSLSKIKDIASRRDDAGYNPLHFAAQFNHVAATAFLLQRGCPVDGGGHCGATPLHRASFSGATAAMKVLLEWNDGKSNDTPHHAVDGDGERLSVNSRKCCDLLAKDTSFGDESTPLHKAAAGGRYLAVHMILAALRERDASSGRERSEASQTSSLLHNGLRARDKFGRTPLDVAQHGYNNRETERRSVARWDAVAGGLPDWGKCVQLIRNAGNDIESATEGTGSRNRSGIGDTREGSLGTTQQQQTTTKDVKIPSNLLRIENKTIHRLPRLPMHLTRGAMACVDCDPSTSNGVDGPLCLTASWQRDFQKALGDSVSMCFVAPTAVETPAGFPTNIETGVARNLGTTTPQMMTQIVVETRGSTDLTTNKNKVATVESICMRCQKPTVAFYPLPRLGILVCKSCRRLVK